MAHFLDVKKAGDYLHITVTGDNTPEDISGYLADVLKECKQRECQKVLIEENLQGPSINLLQVFEIVKSGSGSVWPAISQIAYVDVNTSHNRSLMTFAQTVAENRGVNARVFTSVADAQTWLTKG